ncbi:hypothetical protein JX266_012093 [Neoarthrinium moseri]|nr:hypothetical protein JX266_012093 [Neoarthrinium moseri]
MINRAGPDVIHSLAGTLLSARIMCNKELPSLPLAMNNQALLGCEPNRSRELTDTIRRLREENEMLRDEIAKLQQRTDWQREQAIHALRQQNMDYRKRIDQQNHNLALIAATVRDVFSTCHHQMIRESPSESPSSSAENIRVYSAFEYDAPNLL